jgi:outer membrane receptor protein involved in Fe transport
MKNFWAVLLLTALPVAASAQNAPDMAGAKALWAGNQLFCKNCHGRDGEGAFGPDLAGRGLSASQFRQAAPNTLDMKQWYGGAYAADTWRLSPRVTLNYGVRWEPYLPQSIGNGAVFTFNPDNFLKGIRSPRFANAPAGLV